MYKEKAAAHASIKSGRKISGAAAAERESRHARARACTVLLREVSENMKLERGPPGRRGGEERSSLHLSGGDRDTHGGAQLARVLRSCGCARASSRAGTTPDGKAWER